MHGDQGQRHRRRQSIALAVGAAVIGLISIGPATAQAQQFLGPDLTPPPDFSTPCGDPCAILGGEGSTVAGATPIQAPDDGTITRLDLRDQNGASDPVPVELIQMDLVGANQFHFKSFHPLGQTSVDGINTFTGLNIPVDAGTALGIKMEPDGTDATVDGYATAGEGAMAVFDPAPAQGANAAPNNGGPELQPAIRLQFVPEGPTGEKVDLQVTKTRTSKRRPGIGGTSTFEVTVKNNGPGNATGVEIYDGYDDPDLIQHGTKGAPCNPNPFGTAPAVPTLPPTWGGNTMLICPIGNLAAGASKTLTFTFEVGPLPFGVRSKVVRNYAAALANEQETTYVNNYDDGEIKVRRAGCRVKAAITGTSRADNLKGKKKPEAMYGLGGSDKMKGKKGNDCMFGHEGRDKMVGGPGKDLIDGGKGNDKLKAVDGKRDKVDCGKGRKDKAVVDKKDRVKRNCEKVRVR